MLCQKREITLNTLAQKMSFDLRSLMPVIIRSEKSIPLDFVGTVYLGNNNAFRFYKNNVSHTNKIQQKYPYYSWTYWNRGVHSKHHSISTTGRDPLWAPARNIREYILYRRQGSSPYQSPFGEGPQRSEICRLHAGACLHRQLLLRQRKMCHCSPGCCRSGWQW